MTGGWAGPEQKKDRKTGLHKRRKTDEQYDKTADVE